MCVTQLALQQIMTTSEKRHQGYLRCWTLETRPSGGEGSCSPYRRMLFYKLTKHIYFRCSSLFIFIGEGFVVVQFSRHEVVGGGGGIRRRMLNREKMVLVRNLYHSPRGLVARVLWLHPTSRLK